MTRVDPLDFQPALIRVQEKAPSPLGRAVLWAVLSLLGLLGAWAAFARLDIVAVAEGKLVPATYLKIVQPAEQGIVKEILVSEGEQVKAGQVLIRMDAALSEADTKTVSVDREAQLLALRRVDAQLSGRSFVREPGDTLPAFDQVAAQYAANIRAYESALAEQQSISEKARFELAAAKELRSKLEQVLPHYREQEDAFARLQREGHVSRVQLSDKQRERIEHEQDFKSQEFIISSAQATIAQSERRAAQIRAEYEKQLRTERVETAGALEKLNQQFAKAEHRQGYLELKAPQDGTIKDLATHTVGAVTTPGAVLMTLVPRDEELRAEVWVHNDDIGFVRSDLPAKIKLSAFSFQKYGMLDGRVAQVSADAVDQSDARGAGAPNASGAAESLLYRTLIHLDSQVLDSGLQRHELMPGMRVSAEIKLGTRSVMEYLVSPITKAFHEAGRER